MKLLVCATESYPYGSGIANVAYNIINKLKEMDIKCEVCSPYGDADIKIKRLRARGISGLLYYWYRVGKHFKENDYDVAWLHNPLFIGNNPFQRSLITIHTTYYGYLIQKLNPKIYYKIASKIEKYCLNKIDENIRFTAVSPEVCKELEEIGISKERIIYIPNGVDIERFKPTNEKKRLRKKLDIPENDTIILSLGRLTEQKQPYKLIEVFSLVEKEFKDISLVIVGKGELLEQTKILASKKNLEKVRFMGYVDEKDIPYLYACSDYYIMTSKYEGQPLTLFEAMASGLPCIVSDIPNLNIVEEANSGIMVDFNSKNAADKIIEDLNHDNSIHSRNAREYAVNNLDWKIIAGRYLEEFDILRELHAKSPKSLR